MDIGTDRQTDEMTFAWGSGNLGKSLYRVFLVWLVSNSGVAPKPTQVGAHSMCDSASRPVIS